MSYLSFAYISLICKIRFYYKDFSAHAVCNLHTEHVFSWTGGHPLLLSPVGATWKSKFNMVLFPHYSITLGKMFQCAFSFPARGFTQIFWIKTPVGAILKPVPHLFY
jgi:hypothetical protein